jgi:hypothetical protein
MITIDNGEAVLMMSTSLQVRFATGRWIIGVVLLALALAVLAGCGTVLRLAYSQAPTLAYWRIDGYVDLTDEQGGKVRDAIDRWFEWHRRAELPRYVTLLVRAQREVMEPTATAAQFCAWRDEGQRRFEAALDEAAPALASLVLSLTPQQIRHMERKLAKGGEELKRDYAQRDRGERLKASFKRTLERFETLYGDLDEVQRAKLTQLLAASSFDAERWLAEREHRNRDMIATLTSLAASGRDAADPAKAQAQAQDTVRLLAERTLRSPRPDYRAYQERLTQQNCALAATMHNLTTTAQREHARDKLKGWEEDVRLILAGGSAPSSNGAAPNGNSR